MRRRANAGFSLLELAIVVAIVGMLALIAVPSLMQMLPRFRLNRTVREFCDHVQEARLLAISEGVEYRMCFSKKDPDPTSDNIRSNSGRYTIEAGNKSSGSTSWDPLPRGASNAEGIIDLTWTTSNREYAGISLVSTLPSTLGGTGMGNTDCLVFSPRGWLSNNLTDFRWNYIQIEFRNKAANPRKDVRWVQISQGGIARIRTQKRTSTSAGDSQ